MKGGTLKDVELFVPPSGPIWRDMIGGFYDEFLYESIKPLRSPKGCIVWDVGAHVGYHSLAFSILGAEVLAFEPNTANVERLVMNVRRNTALAPHIRHMAVALSDTDGEMTFKQSEDLRGQSTGSHLVKGLPPLEASDYAKFNTTVVPTVRIDTLVEKRGEKPPDIIKIDVEGAEELVLKGGSKTIQQYRPILLIEVHHICLMYSVQKLLTSWGYVIRLLDQEHASSSRCFIVAFFEK